MFSYAWADNSDFATEELQRQLIERILSLGSLYSNFRAEDDFSPFALRCTEVQLRFLMSSDLYERKGLFDTLLDILEEDLAIPAIGSEGNHENSDQRERNDRLWKRCCNALTIVARIPSGPVSTDHKREIFDKLLELDKNFVGMTSEWDGTCGNLVDHLIVVRRALIRFVSVVGKSTVEVMVLKLCLMCRTIF